MLLLTSNQSIKEIQTFKNQTNFNLDFVRYTLALSELNINALPITLIINKQGKKVTEIIVAPDWVSSSVNLSNGEVIPIDDKVLKRKETGNATQNSSAPSKIALNLLRQGKQTKQ